MILVTGATGNVGRPLVAQLLEKQAKVRAVTRDPQAGRLPEEVDVVGGDLGSPQSLADSLDGVSAVFLNPAAIGDSSSEFLALAAARGVERVVLLSSASVGDEPAAEDDPLALWHQHIEAAVRASGLKWTILRPVEFASNVLQQWTPQIRQAGMVFEVYSQATTALIHERDIAAVAAQTLLSDEHAGQTYLLTGPQSLTRAQMLATVAETLGRPVAIQDVSREQALEAMVTSGFPQPIAESILKLQQQSVGHDAYVSDAVERITGRPALTFSEWTQDHAADLG
ncbi:MAG TPA: NAD(P)H-binding protein [Jatrophihabitans sp.]|uniref:NAD(P)H-binding protein n=1 Tax=Jatrophihabitans sp. TaxID=1932789 RepID=UPI002EDDFC83